jgi:hypothetical protein
MAIHTPPPILVDRNVGHLLLEPIVGSEMLPQVRGPFAGALALKL